MRNYLVLREKARAFRADPEVQEALAASRVPELAEPTLAPGESLDDFRSDDSFDAEAAARRGMGYERLDQLAMDHLFGIR
jgi:xylose isomerase